MNRKPSKPQDGSRKGAQKRSSTGRDRTAQATGRIREPRAAIGTSRLRVTLIQHESVIWNVYLRSERDADTTTRSLEFERADTNGSDRTYCRALTEKLEQAFQTGQGLQRDDLVAELELAMAGGERGR